MNTYNLDAVNPLKAKDGIVDNPTDVIYLPKQYQYSFYNQIVTMAKWLDCRSCNHEVVGSNPPANHMFSQ